MMKMFLFMILPAYAFAGTDSKGINMDVYGTAAAYGFLLLVALFFLFFILSEGRRISTSVDKGSTKVRKQIIIRLVKPVLEVAGSAAIPIGLAAQLKLIQYSIISLIFLYVIIFILLI